MRSHRYALCIRNQSASFVSADVEWLMDVTAMKFEGLPNVCLADRVGCHEDTCTFEVTSICVHMAGKPVTDSFAE